MNPKDTVLYANNVVVSNSLFETRLEFSIETPSETNDDMTLEKMADIRMSPQLAKKLRDILTQSIDIYEKNVGTIPNSDIVTKEG